MVEAQLSASNFVLYFRSKPLAYIGDLCPAVHTGKRNGLIQRMHFFLFSSKDGLHFLIVFLVC
jgi:hypothetical protein